METMRSPVKNVNKEVVPQLMYGGQEVLKYNLKLL